MKKLHLLKRTLLLLALIVGCVSVWGANNLTLDLSNGTGWTIAKSGTSGSGSAVEMSKDGITITANKGYWASNQLRVYSGSTFAITSSIGVMSSITLTYSDKTGPISNFTNGTATINPAATSISGSASGQARITQIQITYTPAAPAYTITAQSNNNSYGTVSLSGSVITANPADGYRVSTSTPYTVSPAESATVSQDGDEFTVTPSANTTVTINFEAIPTYTVTFNAEGGSCDTESAPETIGGGGVTLPTATIGVAGWEFAGWAADAVDNTTTQPTLYKAGSTYYPTIDTELHAVYTLSETGYAYTRVTSLNQINASKKIAVTSQYGSKILTHDASIVNAPTETNNEITVTSDQMFTLSGDNTTGYVLTGAGGTLSQETLSTSGENDQSIDWSGTNNKWIIELNTYADNLFALRNAASDKAALEQYSGWKTEYHNNYSSRQYTAMKLYIPKTAYNSNPSAIITPTVAFDSADPVTLYLDGTTENTNTATVTGVSKTINYTSSNTGVATVNSEGVVTAVGIGTTTITASVDAELGVSTSASDTYNVTVKSATTIAGLKTLYDAAQNPAKAFVADLTDAVVTYVNGDHAYIQDATGAIYASCGSSLTAGNKINGAVSGTITAPYKIDEIKTIDLSAATVTEDGVIPTVLTKTVAEVKANAAALDGQLVTIKAVTVDKPSTTTTLKDGSKIEEVEATITMYSPNSGASVNDKEKGNFTGFVSLYNGNTPRINLYVQSQFVKTHNAPTAQTLSFEGGDEEFDEVTSALSAFTGKSVEGAHTAVTYSKVDASSIIGDFNTETGALTLNGACGTATITATAAAGEVVEEGVTTPYLTANTSYTITVNPRYMVTFSVNGVETVLRQAASGATIAVPTPAACGDYTFVGWSTSTVDATDVAPSMTEVTNAPTANATYYAVFAKQTVGDDENVELYKNTGSTGTDATSGITASGNINTNSNNGNPGNSFGLTSSSNKTATFTNINISTAKSANLSLDYRLQKSGSSYTSLTVTQYDSEDDVLGTPKNITGSDQDYHTSEAISLNTACVKITIVCSPVGSTYNTFVDNVTINVVRPSVSYKDYRTSLPTVEVTITDAQYATFCYARELNVEGTGVTAYTASANGEGEAVTLTKISNNIIPANTGVILFAETTGNYEINVSETGKEDEAIAGNELVGVTTRTSIPETSAGKYNYIFSKKGDVIGFYRASGAYLLPNRAYLSTSKRDAAAREFMAIMFDEGETTSLREVRGLKTDVRGEFFNLNGQRVATPVKGNIYIVNGKKVMFK